MEIKLTIRSRDINSTSFVLKNKMILLQPKYQATKMCEGNNTEDATKQLCRCHTSRWLKLAELLYKHLTESLIL